MGRREVEEGIGGGGGRGEEGEIGFRLLFIIFLL